MIQVSAQGVIAVVFAAAAAHMGIVLRIERQRYRETVEDADDTEARLGLKIETLELALSDAKERLIQARKDGYTVDPPASAFVAPRDEELMPAIFVDFLDGYEPEVRAKYERIIRAQLGKQTPMEILKGLELRRGES